MKRSTNSRLLQTTYSCLKAHKCCTKYLQDLFLMCLTMKCNACTVVKQFASFILAEMEKNFTQTLLNQIRSYTWFFRHVGQGIGQTMMSTF